MQRMEQVSEFKDRLVAVNRVTKVTKGGSWDENWGVGGKNGENVKFTVADEQTVTVTFVAETGAISVVMSGGEENPELGDYGIAALVVAMMAAPVVGSG